MRRVLRKLRLNHPPTVANTIPPAKNDTPVMTAASSNHTQLFRMVRLKLAELSCTHPMAVAHTAPPAKSVTPAMNIAVSNRVIIQLLRMARLNRWTVSELAWPRTVNEWLISFTSAWGRIKGGNAAARDRHNVVSTPA